MALTDASTLPALSRRERFCLNVNLYIREERREEFLRCTLNNQNNSLQEPACLQFTWGEDTKVPNSFYFHEAYQGEQGFDAHCSTPHFAVWEAFAGSEPSPFTQPPQVVFFKTQTDDSIARRVQFQRFWRSQVARLRELAGGAVRFNYVHWGVGAVRAAALSVFVFLEQFDPNPVTEEGKKRKLRLQAQARGEQVEEQPVDVLPSFLGW